MDCCSEGRFLQVLMMGTRRGHTRCSVLLPFMLVKSGRFSHHDERLRAHLVILRTTYPTFFVTKEMGCEEGFTRALRVKCANLNDPRPTSRKRSPPSSQDLEKRRSRQIGKRRGNDSNQNCWAPPLPSSRNPMTSS